MNKQCFPLYVGNLDKELNEQILYNTFSAYGPLYSVKIMKHMLTKESRGFGFVNFLHADDAQKAR